MYIKYIKCKKYWHKNNICKETVIHSCEFWTAFFTQVPYQIWRDTRQQQIKAIHDDQTAELAENGADHQCVFPYPYISLHIVVNCCHTKI